MRIAKLMLVARLTALLASLLFCSTAVAIDRVEFEFGAVELPGSARMQQLRGTLRLQPAGRASLELRAANAQWLQPSVALQNLRLQCGVLLADEPRFQCTNARVAAREARLGSLAAAIGIEYQSQTNELRLTLDELVLAGGRLQGSLQLLDDAWQIRGAATGLRLALLLPAIQPWWSLPPGLSADGVVSANVDIDGRGEQLAQGRLQASIGNLDLQNESATVGSEKLNARIELRLRGEADAVQMELEAGSDAGQALAGPILMDFSAYPLQLQASARYRGQQLDVGRLQFEQRGLARGTGTLQLIRRDDWRLQQAAIEVDELRFPAAYTSLLQITLAATDFGTLDTRGSARGRLGLRDGSLAYIDLNLDAVGFADAGRQLQLDGLQGELHWRAAGDVPAAASKLGWNHLQAYGLDGGAAQLQFIAQGTQLQLGAPARIPLFDGALAVQRFEARELGSSAVTLSFDATLEPISMTRISRAFGWPEMAGQLSGRIPGLEFRRGVLSVAGEINAEVFGGRITANQLQLTNALSNFPRLTGNFTARRLDLEQITRTFPIGSITGRLDADIRGLELFDWSPIAFDANLYTTPGDRSRHRISQKAVDSLTRVGGGGGVMGALQSGFLSFFKEFGYDRIGLRCQLRNDVCVMSGIERDANTFYIVKGGGLPRIDVVATSGRIAWARMVGQINSALESGDVTVR